MVHITAESNLGARFHLSIFSAVLFPRYFHAVILRKSRRRQAPLRLSMPYPRYLIAQLHTRVLFGNRSNLSICDMRVYVFVILSPSLQEFASYFHAVTTGGEGEIRGENKPGPSPFLASQSDEDYRIMEQSRSRFRDIIRVPVCTYMYIRPCPCTPRYLVSSCLPSALSPTHPHPHPLPRRRIP